MKQLAEKAFKDLADMIEIVSERFFVARKMYSMENGGLFAEKDLGSREECQLYIKKVFDAFSTLNESERNLINNEFFFQSYHNWWESIYSKATFYRYKKRAMVKFLGAFYNA